MSTTLKEQVKEDPERLDEGGLREAADLMAFLRFRTRRRAAPASDEAKMAALCAGFAEEDHALAEAGAWQTTRQDLPAKTPPGDRPARFYDGNIGEI